MESEFVIPLSKDDLLCAEEGSYVVEEVLTVRCLREKLSEAVSYLENGGPSVILGQFDVFFSVIKHFSDMSNAVKFECWQSLHNALLEQMNVLITVFDKEDIDRDTKKQHRNTLKMLSYLLTQFTEEFEAEDCKPSTVTATSGRGRGKGSKAKKQSTLSFDWAKTKEEFLRVVTQLLQINIVSLWEPPVVEEEFVNIFANCCYKFFENPALNRDKHLRDSIVDIIAILVKKYNHSLSVCVKVIQLLQHFEHLISPMAQLVQVCAVENGVRSIVVEIIREIGQIDPRDLARDTSGTKCYSEFLVELASRIPEHILPNISLLLCHLDGESYSMRNGVLGVMGELVISRLSQDELDENAKKTRDQILDRLQEHLHDVHAFVRSKVLQIWQNICREKAIPLARQQNLLGLVIGRLKDKSSMVRKNAVHLLKEFLMSSPFGAQLPLEKVIKKLEEETEKLKRMAPELNEEEEECEVPEECNSEELKQWFSLECAVRAVVEEHWQLDDIVDEDGEHVEFQGDVHEALEFAMMKIKRELNSGDYEKALAVLKAAVITWPDYAMFSTSSTKDKDTAEQTEDNSEKETRKDKDETVERELSLLKAIFLNPEFGPVTIPERSSEEDQDTLLAAAENLEENPEEQTGIVNEVSKQQIVVQYLKDYVSFHTKLQEAIVVICQLLGSKTTTDVQEAIEFLVVAYEFGLSNALQGVRRMLLLVWSKDNSIKETVVEAYERLYLHPQVQGQRAKTAAIVRNLIALTQGASIGELTSLDELVYKLMKSKLIPNNVVQLLWERFTMKAPQTTQEESRGALKLLGMLARAQYEIVQSNIDVLVNTGLGDRAKDDALLVKDTCTVLLKLNKDGEKRPGDNDEPLRFASDHVIFQRLTDIVVSGITSALGGMWVPMAEEALNVIYQLAEHPDVICGTLIKNLMVKVFGNQTNVEHSDGNGDEETPEDSTMSSCLSHLLGRLLALVGHVALRQVVHLDGSILGEIKRRERIKEDEKGKKKNNNRTPHPGQQSETTNQTPRTKESANEALEDELGLTGASAEDTESEYIKTICDHEIVTGNNLLSLLSPLIVTVCNNPTKYVDPQLRAAASLALAKFMLVSAEFCEKNLQLLFTILGKSPHAIIRANTIISLGDLTFRFPNLIEPWTPNLYARLRDESCQVRKNTLMVLTHLILNDMVKVKGQISEMAACLEDKDKRIADLAKLFFLELSKKGNAVYNILPDVISRLSDPDSGVQEEPFRNIMRYLFSFIQKDRQCECLVEKLCHRFRATRTERQWRDLAFCLAQLSYNDRGVRKLQENFACFQDKLSDADVYGFFSTIIGKCKKFAKPEMKVVVEELEGRIASCHERGVEDEAGYERANQASAAARVLVGKSAATPAANKTRSHRGRTPASRRRKADSLSDEFAKPKAPTAKKSARKSKKKVIEFESDDEESLDMFGDEDWDELLGDDSDDSDNEENLNPNIRSGKSAQKATRPASSRKKKQLKV